MLQGTFITDWQIHTIKATFSSEFCWPGCRYTAMFALCKHLKPCCVLIKSQCEVFPQHQNNWLFYQTLLKILSLECCYRKQGSSFLTGSSMAGTKIVMVTYLEQWLRAHRQRALQKHLSLPVVLVNDPSGHSVHSQQQTGSPSRLTFLEPGGHGDLHTPDGGCKIGK